jgi:hypothetical protein
VKSKFVPLRYPPAREVCEHLQPFLYKQTTTYFDIAFPLEVEDSKRADISYAADMNGELSAEVDDSTGARRQREHQDERRQDYRKDLLCEDGKFHLEHLAKFSVHLR